MEGGDIAVSSVDERVVRMQFDNTGFEAGATKAIGILEKLEKALRFDGAAKGIDDVKSSIGDFNLDDVSSSVEECSSRFGAFEAFVTGIFFNLGNRVTNFGLDMAKNLTVKPLADGFSEYELQMKSVQTILSNAGSKLKESGYETQEEQIAVINSRLDELNTYADKTIYNFSEMTRNIGTFTAAGVDLDTATKSIQGIANLAAASGSSSQQASTAMYQLSQAIAAGSVKLQDWNSVVNAGMGGELFQEALKRTARVHGVAVDEMIEKNGSFRESLQEGWITSDILTETLEQLTMATNELSEAEAEEMKQSLIKQGYTEKDAEAILELANNAQEAATKVRTWTQLWDTVGEALGSGWATTWRTIVGDFLEATDLFTHLSNGITGIIGASADARNKVLADWAGAGGRTALVDGIKYSFDAIVSIVETVGHAFSDVFGITSEQLYNISTAFATFAEKLVPSKAAVQFLYDALYNVFTVIHSILGVFGNFIRIILSVAGAVWKVIAPFVKFGLILAGGILEGIARLSSFILMLTDRFEEFASFIMSKFGSAITFVYGLIAELVGAFGFLFNAIESVFTFLGSHVSELANAAGAIILESKAVQSLIGSFTSLKDTVKGKVVGAFESLKETLFGTKEASDDVAVAAAKPVTPLEKITMAVESFRSKFYMFVRGFYEASDKVEYFKMHLEALGAFIKGKFLDAFSVFSSPRALGDAMERWWSSLVDSIYDIFGDTALGDAVFNAVWLLTEPLFYLKKQFLDVEDDATWGDVFKPLLDGIKKRIDKIRTNFEKVKSYFSDLLNSGKTVPQMIGTVLADAYDKIKEFIGNLPTLIANIKDKVKEAFSKLVSVAGDFRKNFVERVRNLISELPTPAEVGAKIGNIAAKIKESLVDKIQAIDFSSIFSKISGAFKSIGEYISSIKISLPKGTFSEWIEDIKQALSDRFNEFSESVDFSGIKNVLGKITDFVKKLLSKKAMTLAFATFLDFFHSIASLFRGIGKFGKNFKSFGESIGEGLSNFGQGFTKFKQQTKAQAFQRIAIGILILAGALWVLSKIPADRLMDVSLVMIGLAAGLSVFILAIAGISKLGDLDLESTGKGIAGFGIGILALAGAIWIFSKLPKEDVDENIERVERLIILVGMMLAAISATGGNLQGAAATLIAMGVSITLLTIPIFLLGHMDDGVLRQGEIAVGILALILAGCVALMEFASKNATSILGAAPALLALAIAVTLLTVPIFLLGHMDTGVLTQGGVAVGLLALVLSAAVGMIGAFGANAMSILAATPAILALTAAILLLTVPVYILGTKMTQEELTKGGVAVGGLTVLLGGVIALIGAVGVNALGILAGSVALIAMAAAVGLVSLVISALAKLAESNPEALETAMWKIFDILAMFALGLAALSIGGVAAGTGLAALAGGIIALSIALVALAGAIMLLQSGPDWGAITQGLSSIAESAAELGRSILDGLETIITEGPAKLVDMAFQMAKNLIDTFKQHLGINSPSKVFEEFGGQIVEGLTGGIQNFLGSIGDKAIEIGSSLLQGVADIPGKMMDKGSEIISSFTDGIGSLLGGVVSKGAEIGSGVVDGVKDLAGNLKQKATDGISNFVSGISGKVSSVKNKAKEVFNGTVDAFKDLKGKLKTVATNGIDGFVSAISSASGKASAAARRIAEGVKSGVGNLYSSLRSAGINGVQGFINGLGSMSGALYDKARSIGSNALDAIKRALGIKSPSRRLMEVGVYTIQGFINGINSKRGKLLDAVRETAEGIPLTMEDAIKSISLDIDDILETDYTPEITPVINAAKFNSGMDGLASMLDTKIGDLSVGNLNYTGELSAKISDYNELNRKTLEAVLNNGIDYDRLGVAVANALISSGVHVEMDGGQLMGYLAGEIKSARRMYG